jgi:hypothetical protein
VKFGHYLRNLKPLDLNSFVDHLIKQGVHLNHWTLPQVYGTWVIDFVQKESPFAALERCVKIMQDWASSNNDDWNNFLHKVNAQLATEMIRTGKISPWLLYSTSGQSLLERLSDEQINLIQEMVDPTYWSRRFKQFEGEAKQVNLLLKEYGI